MPPATNPRVCVYRPALSIFHEPHSGAAAITNDAGRVGGNHGNAALGLLFGYQGLAGQPLLVSNESLAVPDRDDGVVDRCVWGRLIQHGKCAPRFEYRLGLLLAQPPQCFTPED